MNSFQKTKGDIDSIKEHEAWLYLAHAWENALPFGRLYRASVKERFVHSLCVSVCCYALGNEQLENIMTVRMESHRPLFTGFPYWWPRNARGAQSRAQFCYKMAELCGEDVLQDGE